MKRHLVVFSGAGISAKSGLNTYRDENGLWRDKSLVELMRVGEEVEINLCRVEKTVYDFWFGFNNYILFGNSQFISNQGSLNGNVAGGYGIFSAQASSSRYIKLE